MPHFKQAIEHLTQHDGWESWRPYRVDRVSERGFAEFGVPIHVGKSDDIFTERMFNEVRVWLSDSVEEKRLNAGYFDTTTLEGVRQVLLGDVVLNPALLFDLANFISAVCLYDHS